jgi:hypothetical protein
MFLVAKGAAVVERLDAACSVLNGVLLQTCCNMSVLNCVLFCHNLYMTFFLQSRSIGIQCFCIFIFLQFVPFLKTCLHKHLHK